MLSLYQLESTTLPPCQSDMSITLFVLATVMQATMDPLNQRKPCDESRHNLRPSKPDQTQKVPCNSVCWVSIYIYMILAHWHVQTRCTELYRCGLERKKENTTVQLHSRSKKSWKKKHRHPTPGNPPNPWARRSDESWMSCGTVSAGVTGIYLASKFLI